MTWKNLYVSRPHWSLTTWLADAVMWGWDGTHIGAVTFESIPRTLESHMPRAAKKNAKTPKDAIAVLKADHREVEGWFAEFEKARSEARKADLAAKICTALKVHTTIEEEIFYPAFLEEVEDRDLHHEAIVEHDGAKKLIAEIEGSSPRDEFFDAKVKVLSEMIKHHVKEEEQRGGMFAEAKQSRLDLKALGQRLAARKAELMRTPAGTNSRSVRATKQRGDGLRMRGA